MTDTVKVAVCVGRTAIIDNDVDSLNINATTEDISSDQYSFFESLEDSVAFNAFHHISFGANGSTGGLKCTALLVQNQNGC